MESCQASLAAGRLACVMEYLLCALSFTCFDCKKFRQYMDTTNDRIDLTDPSMEKRSFHSGGWLLFFVLHNFENVFILFIAQT